MVTEVHTMLLILLTLFTFAADAAPQTRRKTPRRAPPSPRSRQSSPELRTQPTPDPSDVWKWQAFTSEAGRFTISFPGIPKVTTEQVPTERGALTNATHAVETTVASFVLMYGDIPDLLEADLPKEVAELALDGGRDQMLADGNSQLLSERRTRIAGHPARDMTVLTKTRSLHRARAVLVGRRIYVAFVSTEDYRASTRADKEFYERIISRYFDSFAPEPPPPSRNVARLLKH
jgi:hypothetical protein